MSELCGEITVAGRPRGECILPVGHEGEHKSVCGALSGPITDPPFLCALPEGHGGSCAANAYLCSAKLHSVGSTFACELEPGHEGEHRGRPYPPADGVEAIPTFWTDEAVGAVLPEPTGEEPQDDADAESGPEDAALTAESVLICECGHTLEQHDRDTPLGPVCGVCKCAGWNPSEEIVQTAPIFEVELVISSCGVFVQRLPGGGRQLKVVPVRQTPQGPQLVLPAYVLEFATPDAWEVFKDAIENDGKPRTNIVTASHLPPVPGPLIRKP